MDNSYYIKRETKGMNDYCNTLFNKGKERRKLKMLNKTVLLFVLFFVHATIAPLTIVAEDAKIEEGWEFPASVNLWMPTIGGEFATGGDIDFDTIIENLDFTVMSTLGARKGKWSFLTDVVYMDLECDDNAALGLRRLL